jgi:hypothetical protein
MCTLCGEGAGFLTLIFRPAWKKRAQGFAWTTGKGSPDGQSNNIETALAFFGSIGGLPACISNLYAINSDSLKPIPGPLKIYGREENS